MANVDEVLNERASELSRKQSENALLQRQLAAMEQKIVSMVESMDVSREALSFCESLANSRRGAMKGNIESVITEAVRLIYGDTYAVELSYAVKNNRSFMEIEMVRQTKQGEVRRNMDGFGGGMADTISVPMRLMVLLGSKQTDRICVLDECWKHMDLERVELVGKFIRLLSDRLGMQTILFSHHEGIGAFADRIYEISEKDGTSKVESF